MSPPSDTAPAARKVRPLYWSIRRELWENPAIWIAPLAVEAVVLLAFFVSSFTLPHQVQVVKTGQALNMPYAVAAGAIFAISFFVAVFYALGSLNNERRDRSLLFWKSLPVSDATTVLAKAAIPLVVQPLLLLVLAVATQLVMLIWSTIVLLLNGMDPGELYRHLHLPLVWVLLPYGLLVNALWDVPFYGWLMLVSAWAKRMTVVWAFAPPLLLALFEFLVFRSQHVIRLWESRVFGGFNLAYMVGGKGKVTISRFDQIDPMIVLAHPGLWLGLLFGAAFLAACVWLRRRAEPL